MDLRAREEPPEHLDRLRRVVGEQQAALGTEPLQPPFEDAPADAVGGKHAHAVLLQPTVDLAGSLAHLRVSRRDLRQLLAGRGCREGPTRLRAQGIPGLGRDEIVAYDFAIGPEVEVVPDRYPHQGNIRGHEEMRGSTSRLVPSIPRISPRS